MQSHIANTLNLDAENRGFYAATVFKRIESLISDAEDEANGKYLMVEVILTGGSRIHVSDFGYQNPNFVIVYGNDEKGNKVEAYISHTQVQILLTYLDSASEKTSIGFKRPDDE